VPCAVLRRVYDWAEDKHLPVRLTGIDINPDAVRAVAGLSVPHSPPMALSLVDLLDQLYATRRQLRRLIEETGPEMGARLADLLREE